MSMQHRVSAALQRRQLARHTACLHGLRCTAIAVCGCNAATLCSFGAVSEGVGPMLLQGGQFLFLRKKKEEGKKQMKSYFRVERARLKVGERV